MNGPLTNDQLRAAAEEYYAYMGISLDIVSSAVAEKLITEKAVELCTLDAGIRAIGKIRDAAMREAIARRWERDNGPNVFSDPDYKRDAALDQ